MDTLYRLLLTIPDTLERNRARRMVDHWAATGDGEKDESPRMQHDMAIGIMNLMSLPAFNWYLARAALAWPLQRGIFYSVSLMHGIPLAICIYVVFQVDGMERHESVSFCYRYQQCKFVLLDDLLVGQPIVPRKFRDALDVVYWSIIRRISSLVQLVEPFPEMIPMHLHDDTHADTRRILDAYIAEHHLDIVTRYATTPRGIY
jgi:hypothetical protein